ncbi:alpha-1,6-mannosyltransferase [Sphingomonas sp. PP-F2F-A104-K0414]|uniref:glycosyltransferase n=1 Tax=Sphingomonas sp. PP-F2F-A104-K0414 TaxID=2135661 RepID=UPI0010446201|nr:glycosyltransferase [Sphingomonas sp. PP-F2F-A104-K0414]TCQ01086.1 alpha-1,6-mannosyltransferase [Sphingomonas sp. PP-F2F-A104-K0414]
MRIVDVNEFYSPTGGGVRTYVDRKMGIMADMGHELIVVAPGREDRVEERPGGGRILYLKSPGMPFDRNYGLFWDRAAIHRVLDDLDPDVVECCSPWRPAWFVGDWEGRAVKSFFMHNDNIAAYAQRWFAGVASYDQIERGFAWYSRYMKRFLEKYDVVVTNGPALEKRLRARGVRIDAAMPLGIERGHFSPDLRDTRLRAALLQQCGLPEDGMLLLGLGRHHGEKRWPLVVDAVACAGATLPVGLILIGAGAQTKAIQRRIGGSPHIRMFAPVYDRERLARIMASCDALIHGSEAEPFGLVASEAMASGLPLIVPDTGGCAEVADRHASELYAARDAESAAAAIGRLFARDPALLRRAAAVAARHVRSDREHAVELMDYYAGLVAAKQGCGLAA